MKVELKGLYRVTARGKTYYYAWRNGPRVKGEPGTEEFLESYNKARRSIGLPEDKSKFNSLVARYKASPEYQALADSTKKNWGPWLDRLSDYFGTLSIAAFDRTEKVRPIIRKWRDKYAGTPRTADYGLQVLSRVLAYAVDPLGLISINPCEGIKRLYSGSRAEIIWLSEDINRIKAVCSQEVSYAIDLAAHTGLRLGDLVRLSWSHVGDNAIIMKTNKSRHTREAIVPIYSELRDILEKIPRRSTAVLTNSHGRPWTKDGLGSVFIKAKHKVWPEGIDMHFHDLRGTAATNFYLAGLSEREIAEIMAWDEESVSRIIRRYINRGAAIRDKIKRLDEASRRNGK